MQSESTILERLAQLILSPNPVYSWVRKLFKKKNFYIRKAEFSYKVCDRKEGTIYCSSLSKFQAVKVRDYLNSLEDCQ